jgi:hypothetical protein
MEMRVASASVDRRARSSGVQHSDEDAWAATDLPTYGGEADAIQSA